MSGSDKRQSAKRGVTPVVPVVTSVETQVVPSAGPVSVSQVSLGSAITLSSGEPFPEKLVLVFFDPIF